MLNTSTEYTATVTATATAIGGAEKTAKLWLKAGESAALFFASREAMVEVKAQFCADAIIPALSKADQKILATKLPRKGTNEAINMGDNWQIKIDALASARGKVASYFSRLVGYAFPKEKTVSDNASEATKASEASEASEAGSGLTAAKLAERIASMIKQIQNTESVDGIDVAKVIKGLQAAHAAIKL